MNNEEMKNFIEIGKSLKIARKKIRGLDAKLNHIIQNSSYNTNLCDELIKLCLTFEIECQALIDVLRENNTNQCNLVLTASV